MHVYRLAVAVCPSKNQLKNLLFLLDCSGDRRKEGDLGLCSDPVALPSPLVASSVSEEGGEAGSAAGFCVAVDLDSK